MSPERWAARPESLRGVSEWAAQELVVALSISSEAAESLLTRSLALVHRLPGTLAALEAGALHPGHLWPMLDKVAPIENATVRAEVEASLLRWAAGRVTTPAQLGAKARREVLRRDARAAARQLEKAIRERGVHAAAAATDGMAAVTALLTLPEARLLVQALEAYADAVPDDPENPRTRGQKMADCLLDLVLRPGETDAPSVQLLLTVVASVGTMTGGDEPGEIDGHVVPAEMIRQVLRRFAGQPSNPPDAASAPSRRPPPSRRRRREEIADGFRRWRAVEWKDLERWCRRGRTAADGGGARAQPRTAADARPRSGPAEPAPPTVRSGGHHRPGTRDISTPRGAAVVAGGRRCRRPGRGVAAHGRRGDEARPTPRAHRGVC